MGIIVAIGGGELKDLETLPIDRHIVELTGKDRPRALFIPTASGDPPDYYETFQRVYGGELGCETDVLYLLQNNVPSAILAQKIEVADLVYVGGGNTLKMMRRWRHLGVDALLAAALKRGVVLSGLSAGAICWFAFGHSDSMMFYDETAAYIRVRGLGLVDAIFCPHLDEGDRRDNFTVFMEKYPQMGIGVENCCALEISPQGFRILTARDGAGAYQIYRRRGKMITRPVEQVAEYRPLALLLQKQGA